jgi:hypothetical protein
MHLACPRGGVENREKSARRNDIYVEPRARAAGGGAGDAPRRSLFGSRRQKRVKHNDRGALTTDCRDPSFEPGGGQNQMVRKASKNAIFRVAVFGAPRRGWVEGGAGQLQDWTSERVLSYFPEPLLGVFKTRVSMGEFPLPYRQKHHICRQNGPKNDFQRLSASATPCFCVNVGAKNASNSATPCFYDFLTRFWRLSNHLILFPTWFRAGVTTVRCQSPPVIVL